jgi:hypothetical protein
LRQLGVDSLVAVELRNLLSANVAPDETIFDVTQGASLAELAEKTVKKLCVESHAKTMKRAWAG